MAEDRTRLTGRVQKRQPERRRPLRFEPLESRSLLSVIAVAAPATHSDLPPVESIPHSTETVSQADTGRGENLFPEIETPRQPILSSGVGNLLTGPTAEPSDRPLPFGEERVGSAPSPTEYPHDLIAESMATLTPLPPRESLTSLSPHTVSHNLMPAGDSFAGLAPHPESSGLAGSFAEPPSVLPESRLFVDIVFLSPVPVFARYGGAPTGHSLTTPAQSLPPRSASLSVGADALRDLASLVGTRSDASFTDAGHLAGSTSGQSLMLPATNSAGNSSPVATTSSGSDLGLNSTARFVGSGPANSPDAAEGGYLEIGNVPSVSVPSTPTQETPIWSLDEANIYDPSTPGGQHEDVLPGEGSIAKDDGRLADKKSNDIVQLELAEQDSEHSPNTAEGGMVELAAAAPQNTQPISTTSPQNGDPLPNVKDIELDSGLGLFHAFELATAPTQLGDQAGKSSEKTGAADISPASPDSSLMKNSTTENNDLDRRDAHRPAVLSSVLLVAMAVPIGGILRKRRTSDFADPRRNSPSRDAG
jgi:hypothetical protein